MVFTIAIVRREAIVWRPASRIAIVFELITRAEIMMGMGAWNVRLLGVSQRAWIPVVASNTAYHSVRTHMMGPAIMRVFRPRVWTQFWPMTPWSRAKRRPSVSRLITHADFKRVQTSAQHVLEMPHSPVAMPLVRHSKIACVAVRMTMQHARFNVCVIPQPLHTTHIEKPSIAIAIAVHAIVKNKSWRALGNPLAWL